MRDLLGQTAFLFRHAWLFSFGINLLLLISPIYMMQVFDRVISSQSSSTLLMLTIGAAIGLAVMAALETLRARLFVQASFAIDALLTKVVFSRLIELSANPGGSPGGGPLRDAQTLRQFLTGNAMIGLFDVPWAPLFLIMIFAVHWVMGAVALAGMLLMALLAYWDERATRQRILGSGQSNQDAGRFAEQALRNGEVVNAMGMNDEVVAHWRARADDAVIMQGDASRHAGLIVALTKGLRTALQIAMLCAGAYLVIRQNLSSGVMMAATIILGKATSPMESLISHWRQLVEARGAYNRLNKLIGDIGSRGQIVTLPAPTGIVEVAKVNYATQATSPGILKGISFALDAGESLGIVGPSGSGKSTLARVLLGLWVPQQGTVRIDGADVSQWPKTAIGRYIGYLPQDIELFAGTVGENIARLGDPTVNSDAVIEAAQAAGAHDMILKFPDGYETEVGPGGSALSGGQRQRIALARALYRWPRIVVLDEPNAHLDQEGEEALLGALSRLKERGATVMIITHKASLLKDVDKVLVLHAGQVAVFGPRQDVLNKLNQVVGLKRQPSVNPPERVA